MRKLMLPLTMMLTLLIAARADTVILKDGKIVEGTFIGASADHVTLQTDGRAKCRLAVNEIQLIRFARTGAASPIDQKYNALKGSGRRSAIPPARRNWRPMDEDDIAYISTVRSTIRRRMVRMRCTVPSGSVGWA